MIPLPLPGALTLPGGVAVHTFRLFVVLGVVAGAWFYGRLYRSVAGGRGSPADHVLPAVVGGYALARLASIVAGGHLPAGWWGWLGFDEGSLSLAGACLGALGGIAYAARRAGLEPRPLLDIAAAAMGLGLAVGAWGTGRAGLPSLLPWAAPLPGAAAVGAGPAGDALVPAPAGPGAATAHPLALYLSLAGLAAAVLATALARRRAGSGEALAAFLMIVFLARYSTGFVTPGERVVGRLLSWSQVGDLALAVAGGVLWVLSAARVTIRVPPGTPGAPAA